MTKNNLENINNFGPITLVVLQTTSFCNLDCDYCYLPNRHLNNRFNLDLIEPIFKNIFTSSFLGEGFTICWHAGEPLAVPISFYEEAVNKINAVSSQYNINNCQFEYSVQTNATLINQGWCDLFKKYNFTVGVSLDGPDFLHDRHRKNRGGKGSHAQTMRGISYLQKNDIPVSLISVITKDSLDYPDEIFNFFMEQNLTDVGFNLEEIEGVNQSSTLLDSKTEQKFRAFMERFWELIAENQGTFKLREFERICDLIYTGDRLKRSGLLTPFVMLNIDFEGNFSTFDPELLSIKTEKYGDFILGNIVNDTLESVIETEKFKTIYEDINVGWKLCKNSCEYFGVCGGGAGSNKYWEHGTFRVAETKSCRYYEQIITDIVITNLENSLVRN